MSSFFLRRFLAITLSFLVLACASEGHARTTIVALGDSLTAGYRLRPDQSFPAQLEARLKAMGRDVTVINAGISGDTTTGGKNRIDRVLEHSPHIVIVELGANDMLRGVNPDVTRGNLDSILHTLTQKNIVVVLAGMKSGLNMGLDYASRFNRIYPDLAEKYDVILYPFFLENVAQQPHLNLEDGLHPNKEGIALVVEGILPSVNVALERVAVD